MKILEVITSLQTGGAEKLVADIVPRLMALGHIVDVAIFDGRDLPLKRQLQQCGCRIYSLCEHEAYYRIDFIWKLMRIMPNYDIIHSHNSSPQLFVAIANCFVHKKIITTEHNTDNRKRSHFLLRQIDKWMYERYDKIISISDIATQKLVDYLHSNSKIITIPNGIDFDLFSKAAPDSELLKIKANRKAIVMVAAFRNQKDHRTLIDAMTLLDSNLFELWLVGIGDEKRKVEEYAKLNKQKAKIRFLGVRMDVPNVLKSADIVVMSSHYEGLSLSSLEGMSVGKPFIASDVPGLHEIVKDAGVLVPESNAHELANEIKSLVTNPVYYNEVAEHCYIRAKQYDISNTVKEYNNVYEENN